MATLDGNLPDGLGVTYSSTLTSAAYTGSVVVATGGGTAAIHYRYKLFATCSVTPFFRIWINDSGDNTSRPTDGGTYGATQILAVWAIGNY